MCDCPLYALKLKKDFDYKYTKTGKKSKLIILGSVSDYVNCRKKFYSIPSEYELIQVPCGQCSACRLVRAQKRATQAYCESCMHSSNSFVTLTFGDDATYEYLRKVRKMSRYKARQYTAFLTWSLENREFPLFMKRLRKEIFKAYGVNVRFFHCAEYGENNNRPHHHFILFGFDFPDKKPFKIDPRTKITYYRSELLERCWKFGFSLISDCSYESCRYVASYCQKKVVGSQAQQYYNGRKPEYLTQSSHNGIGYTWYQKYFKTDCLPTLSVPIRTSKGVQKSLIPDYFKKLYRKESEEKYEELQSRYADIARKTFDKRADNFYFTDNVSSSKNNDLRIKRMIRSYERASFLSTSKTDLFHKALSFGISPSTFRKYKEDIIRSLHRYTYKDYLFKSSNEALIQYNRFIKQQSEKFPFLKNIKPIKICRKPILPPSILTEDPDNTPAFTPSPSAMRQFNNHPIDLFTFSNKSFKLKIVRGYQLKLKI